MKMMKRLRLIKTIHGTAVLSTIASNAPGEFMGVAFDAEFLLAKTEDVSSERCNLKRITM